ncbi:MAG: metal ABC transporter permease [Cyanobacteria bacterium P01_B01_bin.77]
MDRLLAPFNYDFMRQALLTSMLIGILCPVIGTYLIVRQMALLGDVVAHAVMGVYISCFLNISSGPAIALA